MTDREFIINELKNYKKTIEAIEDYKNLIIEEEKIVIDLKQELANLSGNSEKTINKIEELSNVIDALKEQQIQAIIKVNIIKILIFLIPKDISRIISFRYIEGRSIRNIALKENYSQQRIYQLHDKGIRELIDVFNSMKRF